MMHGHNSFAHREPRSASPARLSSPLGFYLSSVVAALERDIDCHYDDNDNSGSDNGAIDDAGAHHDASIGTVSPAPPLSWADAGPTSWFALAWPHTLAPGTVLPYAHRPCADDPCVAHSIPTVPVRRPTWPERVVGGITTGGETAAVQALRPTQRHDPPKATRECLIDGGVVPPPGLPPPLEPCAHVPVARATPRRAPSTRARRNSAQ
ncbi:hypothetical protein pneo_cds_519 [Pandoravirus neocaledonia]|uniref:Uncharacterized protein n=1 Tax=Pandoravirus neocaledonia TaxID=2107708 RepID=A0A2U7UCG0_9VIRU|nr:hypothetical protein pneo_cds_519 [Pandoravirus neocaledonia]AVK76126.1 hypothetical protein pneo_cds_519 [Pandoravirus neocaledonia]